jgi:hypothetical protein
VPKSSDYKDAIKALRAIAPNSGLPDYAPQTNEAAIRFNNAWGFGGSPWDSSEGYSTGSSWYDPLKSFGKGALNALSVPQAAAFTSISKLLEGMGVEGEGAMDWSDALGGFSENYRGFDEILGQLGVEDSASRRAVGLGFDIVADPLWLIAWITHRLWFVMRLGRCSVKSNQACRVKSNQAPTMFRLCEVPKLTSQCRLTM